MRTIATLKKVKVTRAGRAGDIDKTQPTRASLCSKSLKGLPPSELRPLMVLRDSPELGRRFPGNVSDEVRDSLTRKEASSAATMSPVVINADQLK